MKSQDQDRTTPTDGAETHRIAFGALALPGEVRYRKTGPLPQGRLAEPWRVQLLADGGQTIGLELEGDTILGRGERVASPGGVDLSDLGAKEKGVSRQHLMLRPTPTRLYLIDLGSTNGTLHNSVPVGPGIARILADGDVLMLGDLILTLRIVSSPSAHPVEKTQPVHQEPQAHPQSALTGGETREDRVTSEGTSQDAKVPMRTPHPDFEGTKPLSPSGSPSERTQTGHKGSEATSRYKPAAHKDE